MQTKTAPKHWLILLAAAGAGAAYLYWFFLPAQRSMAALRGQLAEAEAFIESTAAFGPALEATAEELAKTRRYVEEWEKASPSEREFSDLFGRIHQIAKEAGIRTTRFEPQPPLEYDKLQRLSMVMESVGPFRQVCRFLRELEGQPESIWIDVLQIEKTGEDSENVQCELTLAVFADNSGDSGQVDSLD